MIGANAQITTYRLIRTGTTDAYSTVPTLLGVPAYIVRVDETEAAFQDMQGAFEVFRVESTENLNLKKGDKVVDNQAAPFTYTVHTVSKSPAFNDIGPYTLAILMRPRPA